ncbi:MAG: hypothetical protein HY861_01305 [Chlamydiia bacterium]|nr:hypothetical protein [Chlamydiia bacterium]
MAMQPSKMYLQEHNPHVTQLEQMKIWMHEHPVEVKVSKVAIAIIGAGILITLPFIAPLLPGVAIAGLALTGIVLTITFTVSHFLLHYFIRPHHDMKNHVFTPGACEGGKLYYVGDLPVLSLDSDPYKAGKAHGYLCGEAINQIVKSFEIDLGLVVIRFLKSANTLPKTLKEVRDTIPPQYIREMEGLVDGYRCWAKEHPGHFPKELSLDDVLLLHLLPDTLHFDLHQLEGSGPSAPIVVQDSLVACSAVLEKDPKRGVVFARALDWPSLGVFGTYSLVIHRKGLEGQVDTVDIAVPGLAGGMLTGMNEAGFSVAMNVCDGRKTENIGGMPACFYNRMCLEKCTTIQDLREMVAKIHPLGPYHLTAADPEAAASVHFYQDATNTQHVIRDLTPNNPLMTLNFCYEPTPQKSICHSTERQKELHRFFKNRGDAPLEHCLSVPYVNNWSTMHKVVMEPQTKTLRVAFDNAFASRAPLHTVPTHALFRKATRISFVGS